MLLSLIFYFNNNNNGSIERKMMESCHPSQCDTFEDVSSVYYIKKKLEANKRYCFRVFNDIIINGKPVKITCFDCNTKKSEGYGILATSNGTKIDGRQIFMVESDIGQDVEIWGSIRIPNNGITFISTTIHKDCQILYHNESKGSSSALLLGLKNTTKLKICIGRFTKGRVYFNNGKRKILFRCQDFENKGLKNVLMTFEHENETSKAWYSISSTAYEWKTPIDGFMKYLDYRVYNATDFTPNYNEPIVYPTYSPTPTKSNEPNNIYSAKIIISTATCTIFVIVSCIAFCFVFRNKKSNDIQLNQTLIINITENDHSQMDTIISEYLKVKEKDEENKKEKDGRNV